MSKAYKQIMFVSLIAVLLFAATFYAYTEYSKQEVEYVRGRLI